MDSVPCNYAEGFQVFTNSDFLLQRATGQLIAVLTQRFAATHGRQKSFHSQSKIVLEVCLRCRDSFQLLRFSAATLVFSPPQGVSLPPPPALRDPQHEEDRRHEERWHFLRRVPQSLHPVAAAITHPGSGPGVRTKPKLTAAG